jgi:outer membrane protein assembly factor BamB
MNVSSGRCPRAAVATLALSVALVSACRHFGPSEPKVCGADRDCKLERVCDAGRCVWPAQAAGHPPGVPAGPAAPTPPSDDEPPSDAVPIAATATPQAMHRFGPDHRGRVPFRLPHRKPAVSWAFETGAPVTSSPTFLGDLVVVGSHDGKVYALDASGQKRWTFVTNDLVFSSPAIVGNLGTVGAMQATGKTTASAVVYIGSDDDHLYALDALTGTVRWRYKIGSCRELRGVGPEASRCDVDAGPTVGPDGTIYTGGDGIYAIRPDGTLRWRFPTGGHVSSAPALLPDGTIVAGSQDNLLYAVGPDGTKRWDFRAGDDIESAPSVGEDGTVYVGSDDQKVYAIAANGALKWAFHTGDDVRASPALGHDGTVFIGSFDALMYAIRPDGTLAWTFRTGDRIMASALVDADGAVLFGAQDDRLYALEPDGRLRWSVELGGDVDSSPALGPDGRIYVGSDDRKLYALREGGSGPVSVSIKEKDTVVR